MNIIQEKIQNLDGQITYKQYLRGRYLGKGGFAKCYEITNLETKVLNAVKVISKASLKKSRTKQKLMSEIKIHRSLCHPNIVGFKHFFEDHENVNIILELCSNQTLNELVRRRKRLTELEVLCYSMQLLRAIKYMHKHKIIHRDLKLGNLFLTERMELKVADFGLATKVNYDGERKRTICGTPNYIAPEILEGRSGHSYEVDIWSFGVVFYTMLVGKPPFETNDVKTTYRRIKANSYSFPENVLISNESKDLIRKILQSDPYQRPSLDQILGHAFFNNGGTIPPLLPPSTIACPPSLSYIRQFQPKSNHLSFKNTPRRLESTAAIGQGFGNIACATLQGKKGMNKEALLNTERPKMPLEKYEDNKTPEALSKVGTSSTPQPLSPFGKTAATQEKVEEVLIVKWVDFTTKYGLGYQLSNGCFGVLFNDSTKIILDRDGLSFDYIKRPSSQDLQNHDEKKPAQEHVTTYKLTDYPKDIQKKVTLLQHFRSYLDGKNTKENSKPLSPKSPTKQPPIIDMPGSKTSARDASNQLIYLKKWKRGNKAILFRLSNKIIQVVFLDTSEIILSSSSGMVAFINAKRERVSYPLSSDLENTNPSLFKRLRYAKDMLIQMINPAQQNRTELTKSQGTKTSSTGFQGLGSYGCSGGMMKTEPSAISGMSAGLTGGQDSAKNSQPLSARKLLVKKMTGAV